MMLKMTCLGVCVGTDGTGLPRLHRGVFASVQVLLLARSMLPGYYVDVRQRKRTNHLVGLRFGQPGHHREAAVWLARPARPMPDSLPCRDHRSKRTGPAQWRSASVQLGWDARSAGAANLGARRESRRGRPRVRPCAADVLRPSRGSGLPRPTEARWPS